MKHKVSELEGALLDAAVVKALGVRGFKLLPHDGLRPSSEWEDGGPIIEREPWALPRVNTNQGALHLGKFVSSTPGGFDYYGATPLIAAMRAYVASKLGEWIALDEPE